MAKGVSDDLIGKNYGSMFVLKRGEDFEGGADIRKAYICECLCGHIQTVQARYLKRNSTKKCRLCIMPKKEKIEKVLFDLSPWASAALSDESVCKELKDIFEKVLELAPKESELHWVYKEMNAR